ncbi:lytic murein transglycosylase [Palleronia sp. LCG004]|uniref:lytic murein transglycosylase n=1 Tax=Palleronia sp. LCG004 TaxID=3079304 RepID=UPI0029421ED9|nr:lytic murein transglycosylase [Palleronia sp. LCG004]WOI56139.1 lytic murein transglycosylase [Palleronia sp. LCG004]
MSIFFRGVLLAVALPGVALAQSASEAPAPRVSATPPTVTPSLRPAARPDPAPAEIPATPSTAEARAFAEWVSRFRGRALTQGVSSQVFDAAFEDAAYLPEVIARDRNQSEFTSTIWQYLDRAASDARVENGRAALREHGRILDAIEARYGVEKEVVTAVWGLESAYGTRRGDIDIVSALATLAHDGRRGAFFEAQLVGALKIVQSGDVAPRQMTGSWAGAMGHTQFIPTSYIAYAVDFTGDGRRDIWSDDPTDALASTAAYLANFGWVTGQPWGVEIRLPEGFDYSQASRQIKRMPSDWAAAGVTGIDGAAVEDFGEASILLPAGASGAAFMIFRNFEVIERYNAAEAYVIGVGHLADRLAGGDPIDADWPRDDRALAFAERVELQRRLTEAGYNTRGADGMIGPLTIGAIRNYQRASGAIPDGYASLRLLDTLRSDGS